MPENNRLTTLNAVFCQVFTRNVPAPGAAVRGQPGRPFTLVEELWTLVNQRFQRVGGIRIAQHFPFTNEISRMRWRLVHGEAFRGGFHDGAKYPGNIVME